MNPSEEIIDLKKLVDVVKDRSVEADAFIADSPQKVKCSCGIDRAISPLKTAYKKFNTTEEVAASYYPCIKCYTVRHVIAKLANHSIPVELADDCLDATVAQGIEFLRACRAECLGRGTVYVDNPITAALGLCVLYEEAAALNESLLALFPVERVEDLASMQSPLLIILQHKIEGLRLSKLTHLINARQAADLTTIVTPRDLL